MKWQIACVTLFVIGLTACDQNAGNERGKITPSARNGNGSANIAGKDCKIFVEGSKEKNSKDKGCLDLVALQKCLTTDDGQVARASTVDIQLFNDTTDLSKLEILNDQKLLAQILNEREELKVTYKTKRLKDFRGKFDGLNAIVQKKCESVTLQDENGKIEAYTIEYGDSKRPRIALNSVTGAGGWKTIEVHPGRIVVSTIRPISQVNRCNETKTVLAKTTQELVYGGGGNSRGQIRLGYAFAKLIAENSQSSETLKQLVKTGAGIEGKNQKSRERKAQNQVLMTEAVFADAVLQLNKGQFTNLECPSK